MAPGPSGTSCLVFALTNLFSLSLAVAILKEKYSLVLGVFCEGRKSRTWLLLRTRACKGCERESTQEQTNQHSCYMFVHACRARRICTAASQRVVGARKFTRLRPGLY